METVSPLVVPLLLVLARVGALVATLPVFSWQMAPLRVRAGLALLLAVVIALAVPPAADVGDHWVAVGLAIAREVVTGLAIGLAANLVFLAVRQCGMIIRRQMGLAVASTIDPLTGEQSQPLGMLLEMTFVIFFLVAGGHRLLVRLIAESYVIFPVGHAPSAEAMAEGIIRAGSMMLVFGLKLAAPLVGAFLVLAVILAILARVLPEMNILLASLPLRIGLGLFMAAALVPALYDFTEAFGDWLHETLMS